MHPHATTARETDAENVFESLTKYWYIWAFIGGLIFTFAQFEYRVLGLEAEITAVQAQEQVTATQLAAINVSLGEINTTLKYIQKNTNQ